MLSTIPAQQITDSLETHFAGKIIGAELPYDLLTITIAKDVIKEVIQFLYDDPSLNFKFLTTCCAMHFPESENRFAMVYHLHNLETNTRIRLKAFTNDDPPVYPSLTGIFKAANWMEREAYDFFGFRFTGHPDLRRILNMDNLEGWPLRKEFPLEDPFRRDKDDAMFGR
jgi:NADH-quinone oxidoreductase subunit C